MAADESNAIFRQLTPRHKFCSGNNISIVFLFSPSKCNSNQEGTFNSKYLQLKFAVCVHKWILNNTKTKKKNNFEKNFIFARRPESTAVTIFVLMYSVGFPFFFVSCFLANCRKENFFLLHGDEKQTRRRDEKRDGENKLTLNETRLKWNKWTETWKLFAPHAHFPKTENIIHKLGDDFESGKNEIRVYVYNQSFACITKTMIFIFDN